MNNIKLFIVSTVNNHPYGIEITELEEKVSEYIGSKFDPCFFKVEDFEEFLLLNLEDCLDINV